MSGVSKIWGTAGKPVQWFCNKFDKNPEKALALTTVGSIIVKDGVGCYKYVTQSMHNDKIPEDKRNFVAALDLTNGLLMIVAQIGMFFAMRKFSEPIFNKIFKGSFGEKAQRFGIERFRMLQRKSGEIPSRKLDLTKLFGGQRGDSLSLFKFIADIAAATIVGKRIIVPFIATPLASVVKDKMQAHQAGKKAAQNIEKNKEVKNSDKDLVEIKNSQKVDDDDEHEIDDDD